MVDLAALRLTWEPRMLSILRMIIGLLYMEHGLAKVVGFPLQPNHKAYELFTLNPGIQGLLELVGGLLLAFGLFTRPVAFVLAGNMAVAYFIAHAPKGFFPLLNGGELAIVIASYSYTCGWPAAENGASIDYARRRPRPPYRRAERDVSVPSGIRPRVPPTVFSEPRGRQWQKQSVQAGSMCIIISLRLSISR